MDEKKLLKYAVDYLSKYDSSKNNLITNFKSIGVFVFKNIFHWTEDVGPSEIGIHTRNILLSKLGVLIIIVKDARVGAQLSHCFKLASKTDDLELASFGETLDEKLE